jgi:1-phosphofructokinase family hexose kinase
MSRVVTVTANPALDQTIWVPGFRAGEVNRVAREVVTPGGKGVNVAGFLRNLGHAVTVTGFLGAPNAGFFEAFFADTGIEDRFVRVPGTTRTGIKIVDDQANSTTDVNFPGFEVDADHLAALERTVGELAEPGGWVALAGSLPQGAPAETYRRLAEAVHERGGKVALDTSGAALTEALRAGPDLIKPNREELQELVGRALPGQDDIVDAAQELAADGIGTVVVSLGADGAVFVRDGEAVYAKPPPVTVQSTVGAGDAMVAGTMAAMLQGMDTEHIAPFATACSAVKIARVGPQLDAAAVQETAQAVGVQRLR